MDRKKMLQVLLPAGAAAGMVLLIGVLLAIGESPTDPSKGSSSSSAVVANTDGMSDTLPPIDAPEWKPGPGNMKVWDVKEGEGAGCLPNASVKMHYTGWTLDGKVFDSSVKGVGPRPVDGNPASFQLGSLIKGWQEGIPGMKPGGIRRLYIPYAWAYGVEGRPPAIPPKADLVFEVKLIDSK